MYYLLRVIGLNLVLLVMMMMVVLMILIWQYDLLNHTCVHVLIALLPHGLAWSRYITHTHVGVSTNTAAEVSDEAVDSVRQTPLWQLREVNWQVPQIVHVAHLAPR